MTLVFALEVVFSKRSRTGNVLFRAILGTGKKNLLKQFLQSFRAKNILCNNSDQTCFSDTLTSAGSFGRCWNHHLSGSGINTSLGAQHILMHRKSCLSRIWNSTDREKIPVREFNGNFFILIGTPYSRSDRNFCACKTNTFCQSMQTAACSWQLAHMQTEYSVTMITVTQKSKCHRLQHGTVCKNVNFRSAS